MATIAKKVPYEHFVILLYRFPFTFRFSLKYVDICSQKKLFQNCFVFFILYHFLILFSDIWHIIWKKNSLILRKHVFGSNENMIIYTIFYNQRIIKWLLLENLLLQFFFAIFLQMLLILIKGSLPRRSLLFILNSIIKGEKLPSSFH